MQREIKLDSFEDEAPRKPSPSPATTLKIWLTLYGIFAVGRGVTLGCGFRHLGRFTPSPV